MAREVAEALGPLVVPRGYTTLIVTRAVTSLDSEVVYSAFEKG